MGKVDDVLADVRSAIREGAHEDQPVTVRRKILDFVVDRLTGDQGGRETDLENQNEELRRQVALAGKRIDSLGDDLAVANLDLKAAKELEGELRDANQRLREAADRTPREPAAPLAGDVPGAIDRLIQSLKVGAAIDVLTQTLEKHHGETLGAVRELLERLPPRT